MRMMRKCIYSTKDLPTSCHHTTIPPYHHATMPPYHRKHKTYKWTGYTKSKEHKGIKPEKEKDKRA